LALADIEISAFKAEIEAMRQALDEARAELKVFEADPEHPARETVLRETERALFEQESEIAKLRAELDEQSARGDAQKSEMSALKTEIGALKRTLHAADAELKAIQDCRHAERIEFEAATQQAECALSENEAELVNLMGQLHERSTFIDAQKIEIVALNIEVEALKKASGAASAELRTIQHCRDADRTELKSANEKLIAARSEFEQFQRRVAELVKQIVAQNAEDKVRAQDMENRVIEQSRLLDQRAVELSQLRGEIEIACKAEADLRNATIEIEGRANTAIASVKGETAKLQAAFDRANAERMRLAHEVAKLKRQAEEMRAA
jgi:chromosome segregation ATPase